MHKARIDLPAKARTTGIALLTAGLAGTSDLFTRASRRADTDFRRSAAHLRADR